MHSVLVIRLGGLVWLDRSDMTIAVCRGRKTTKQQLNSRNYMLVCRRCEWNIIPCMKANSHSTKPRGYKNFSCSTQLSIKSFQQLLAF